jgi:hypothetical protein
VLHQKVAESGTLLGVGARQAEGFGRVAVDAHGEEPELHRADIVEPLPSRSASQGADLPGDEAQATWLRRNLTRSVLRRALLESGRKVQKGGGLPSPSTIARLRARLRTAASAQDLLALVEDLTGKKAGRSLDPVRVRGTAFREWLADVCRPWSESDLMQEMLRDTKLGPIETDALDDADRWYLVQSYLDAFFERWRRETQAAASKATRTKGGAQ